MLQKFVKQCIRVKYLVSYFFTFMYIDWFRYRVPLSLVYGYGLFNIKREFVYVVLVEVQLCLIMQSWEWVCE